MNESKYILTVELNRLIHTAKEDNPIKSLLINQEDVELYLSGRNDEFWITDKRIIVYHKEERPGFIIKPKNHQYVSFKYAEVFTISTDYMEENNFNRILITFKNDVQLEIMIRKTLPLSELSQVLATKIFS